MAITFNSTTPAAPNGSRDITWQKDGSGNVSGYVPNGGGGENTQTTNYTAVAADAGKLISCNSASAFTVTLPAAPPSSLWFVFIRNIGTGVVTVSRNGLTIDGKSTNITLTQGDSVVIFTDNTNYFSTDARPLSVGVFMPGVGTNSQILLYLTMDRPCVFPASAPNSQAKAKTAATGSTTYTLLKNGVSFATVVFSASGTVGAWTQASDASFGAGDILEIDGPATADATLANMGITLQGYRF